MLRTVIVTYLELLLPLALLVYGIGMVIYGIVGTAIGIARSIHLFTLVVCILLFLFLVVAS